MDLRFLDDVVKFMERYNLQNRYDHVVFAGASLGVMEGTSPLPTVASSKKTKGKRKQGTSWKAVFFDHLAVAVNILHRDITDVAILEHADCGAYHVFHPETEDMKKELKLHEKMAKGLTLEIEAFCKVQVHAANDELDSMVAHLKKARKPKEIEKLTQEIGYAAVRIKKWKRIKVTSFIMDVTGHVFPL
jgi:dihydroorotase-like cyclic amidohydrolase